MKVIIVCGALIAAAGLGYVALDRTLGQKDDAQSAKAGAGALVDVVVPDTFSANAQTGKTVFDAKCAACHGVNAGGRDGVAPPLVHIIYEPSHHGDEAFQRAVAMGVKSHHWRFGNMPPVENLMRGDVAMIVAYVREMQVANGIQ